MTTVPRSRRTREQLQRDATTRARRLRAAMIERGVSITELHRHSGVAESVIRQIREEQTLRPSESTIGRLADGFDSFENAREDGHRKWPPMDPIWLYDGELEEGREL